MLTDTKLRNLKPRDKLYKVNDREGLYVGVASENGIYGHLWSLPFLQHRF
ncbi:integrase [Klebsiella pneumoniae]|nr:integrase [Klebsiella pneumoniae]